MRAFIALATIAAAALLAATTTSGRALQRRAVQPEKITFTSCGNGADLLDVSSIDVSPNPPSIRNKVLTVTSAGNLKTTIVQGAKITVTATAGTIKKTIVYDMCEEGAKAGAPCPVLPGPRELANVVALPDDDVPIPPFVTVNIRAVGVNADGRQIFCLQGPLKFVP